MLQRIEYLDVAKLIGLALVCFCHIPTQTGIFHIWVYSFHMPFYKKSSDTIVNSFHII